MKFSHILFFCCQPGLGRYPMPRLQPFVSADERCPPPPPPPLILLTLSLPPFSDCVSRGQDLLQSARCSVMSRHVASNLDPLPSRPGVKAGGMDDICHTYFGPLIRRSGPERSRGVSWGAVGSVFRPLSRSYWERPASLLTTRNMLWGYVCARA